MENEEQPPYTIYKGIKVWRGKQDVGASGTDYENTFRTLPPDPEPDFPDEQTSPDLKRCPAPQRPELNP